MIFEKYERYDVIEYLFKIDQMRNNLWDEVGMTIWIPKSVTITHINVDRIKHPINNSVASKLKNE